MRISTFNQRFTISRVLTTQAPKISTQSNVVAIFDDRLSLPRAFL
jgi:hypothetical protein